MDFTNAPWSVLLHVHILAAFQVHFASFYRFIQIKICLNVFCFLLRDILAVQMKTVDGELRDSKVVLVIKFKQILSSVGQDLLWAVDDIVES